MCVALFYVLNRPLWVHDLKLAHALEQLRTAEPSIDAVRDLGLNAELSQISAARWRWMGEALRALSEHITPSSKMQCLHEAMQSLTHHLHSQLRWRKSVAAAKAAVPMVTVGADDIFPALIWLIVLNEPARLASSLSLIEHVSDCPTSGVHAYSFTLFKRENYRRLVCRFLHFLPDEHVICNAINRKHIRCISSFYLQTSSSMACTTTTTLESTTPTIDFLTHSAVNRNNCC